MRDLLKLKLFLFLAMGCDLFGAAEPLFSAGLPAEVQDIICDYVSDQFQEVGVIKSQKFKYPVNSILKIQLLEQNKVCTWSTTQRLQLWDIKTGEWLLTDQTYSFEHKPCILPWAQKLVAYTYSDKYHPARHAERGKIFINHITSREGYTLSGHGDLISVIIPLKKNFIASGSHDHKIKIWDLEKKDCDKTLSGHKSVVTALAFVPENKLISASMYNDIRIWDIDSGNHLIIHICTEPISFLVPLKENYCASVNQARDSIEILDARKRACLIKHISVKGIRAIADLWDNFIAIAAQDNKISIYNIDSGNAVNSISCDSQINDITCTPNGELLVGLQNGDIVKFVNLAQVIKKNIEIDRLAIKWKCLGDKKIEKPSKCVIC